MSKKPKKVEKKNAVENKPAAPLNTTYVAAIITLPLAAFIYFGIYLLLKKLGMSAHSVALFTKTYLLIAITGFLFVTSYSRIAAKFAEIQKLKGKAQNIKYMQLFMNIAVFVFLLAVIAYIFISA